MDRKIGFLVVFLVVMAALPLSAQTTCQQVIDSRSHDDGGSDSWCWLSGLVCYYCWGANPDEHCADEAPCDVMPKRKMPIPIIAEVRQLPTLTPCAAKTLQPEPQQVKLEHLL